MKVFIRPSEYPGPVLIAEVELEDKEDSYHFRELASQVFWKVQLVTQDYPYLYIVPRTGCSVEAVADAIDNILNHPKGKTLTA